MTAKIVGKHVNNEIANGFISADAHITAAEAFVKQARFHQGDQVAELYVFGSTIRDKVHRLASDVDVLIVLAGDTN